MSVSLRKASEIVKSVSLTHKKVKPRLIFLNTSDIGDGKILHSNYSETSGWPGQAKKSIRRNDILFSEIRPANGRWAFVSFDADDFVVSTKLMVIRVDETETLPMYFYKWLTSHATVERLQSLAESRSGTFPQITFDDIGFLEVPLPTLPEQRAIASVLSALDDKIELNRRMNTVLERQARALFADWFVHFGPTRAKMALSAKGAKNTQTSEAPYLAPEIWSLFPDRLDENGVPEGWVSQSVIDQAEWINGAAYKNMHFNKEPDALPVIKIAELKVGVTQKTKWTNTALGEKYRISDGELLFSWSGNPDTSIDTFIWTGGDAWLNQHIFAVRSNGTRSPAFLYTMLKWLNPEFAEIARNKQTTGLGHVTKQDLKRLKVHTGSNELLEKFENLVGPLHARMRANLFEIGTLAQTRDLLLPKLMSGEIRVPEAADIVAKGNVVPFNLDLLGEPVLTDPQEKERDAVIVAAIVRGFGRDGSQVVGNVKYQKGLYFVMRRREAPVQDFRKHAAGPYNPDLAHDGGFAEAFNRRFIKRASRNGHEGNVPADNMAQIDPLMDQYGLKDAIDWVIVRFRDKSRDELGLLATVDHIMCERKRMEQPINAIEIRRTLGTDPEWQHKLSQPEFSESKVRQAISELERLFGDAS